MWLPFRLIVPAERVVGEGGGCSFLLSICCRDECNSYPIAGLMSFYVYNKCCSCWTLFWLMTSGLALNDICIAFWLVAVKHRFCDFTLLKVVLWCFTALFQLLPPLIFLHSMSGSLARKLWTETWLCLSWDLCWVTWGCHVLNFLEWISFACFYLSAGPWQVLSVLVCLFARPWHCYLLWAWFAKS